MLDQNFCDFLEYHLSETFSNSTDITLKGFWCDGIILPDNENDYSKKSINDKREILVKAFIGKDGQGEYSLLIKFGNKSLSRYARDLELKDCVPSIDNEDWYVIDTKANKITIQLL